LVESSKDIILRKIQEIFNELSRIEEEIARIRRVYYIERKRILEAVGNIRANVGFIEQLIKQ